MAFGDYSSSCLPVVAGCVLTYKNSGGIPVGDGYYSDGSNSYYVTGGAGVVQSVTPCPNTCDLGIDSVAGTYPSNPATANGVVTIQFHTTHGPSTYTMNGVNKGLAISPIIVPGLSYNTNYNFTIIDYEGCTVSSNYFFAPAEVPCDAQVSAGGEEVKESTVNLNPSGGLITIIFNPRSFLDKLELIHNGSKKATTGWNSANAGPFDDVYGMPPTNLLPTKEQARATDQFIGYYKVASPPGALNTTPPSRQAQYNAETGSSYQMPAPYQQLIWWQYSAADYTVLPILIIRATGSDWDNSTTEWDFKRIC